MIRLVDGAEVVEFLKLIFVHKWRREHRGDGMWKYIEYHNNSFDYGVRFACSWKLLRDVDFSIMRVR